MYTHPLFILDTLLSAAQSFPNLTTSLANTSNTLTTTQTMANVTSLSQALTRSLASTSSESDNEFMESCRPKSLLEDLEDDDELPDPDDDDDDENEDENEDDDLYDDVLVVSNVLWQNACALLLCRIIS